MRGTIRLLIALALISQCSSLAFTQNTASAAGLPNLGQYKIELTKYQESGQYERDLEAAVSPAKAWLAQQAKRNGKLAIVLDIDETSLSNWPVIKADDFGFIPQVRAICQKAISLKEPADGSFGSVRRATSRSRRP